MLSARWGLKHLHTKFLRMKPKLCYIYNTFSPARACTCMYIICRSQASVFRQVHVSSSIKVKKWRELARYKPSTYIAKSFSPSSRLQQAVAHQCRIGAARGLSKSLQADEQFTAGVYKIINYLGFVAVYCSRDIVIGAALGDDDPRTTFSCMYNVCPTHRHADSYVNILLLSFVLGSSSKRSHLLI